MKKSKLLLLPLIFLTACGSAPTGVDCLNMKVGGSKNEYYVVISCNQRSVDVVIPKEYEGKPVRSIAKDAFSNCESLETITYDGTASDWCNLALYDLKVTPRYLVDKFYMLDENNEIGVLDKIHLTENVTSVGNYQFYKFDSVSSVTLSKTIKSIGANAFEGCDLIETTYFNGLIEDWMNISFTNLYATPNYYADNFYLFDENQEYVELTELDFNVKEEAEQKKEIKTIGKYQFYNFKTIKTIIIPKSVTSIGENAFTGCDSAVIYAERSSKFDGWKSTWNASERPVYWDVNEKTFIEIDGVQFVVEEENVTVSRYVGNANKVVIPSTVEIGEVVYNVTKIGDYAFQNCKTVTSVTIPESVTSVANNAFEGTNI